MPPEHLPPEDPREWLNRARSNLARSRVRQPDVYLEDLCFDAQQASEKSLKALLIARRIRFPFTHNLGELIALLQQDGVVIPESVLQAAALTDYAVEARYPGPSEPVRPDQHTRAVALAEAVVQWVAQQIPEPKDK
jgi:HEPN domain-containing protein